jgi:zinc transporter
VFLPLSFLTGLLGINVAGIPGSSYQLAFFLVCFGLAIVGGLELYFFRRKKWF